MKANASSAASTGHPAREWAEVSDGELAKRVAAGDNEAAECLVRRHEPVVRAFLHRVCFDRSLIDDIVQETFLRVLKHADRYDPAFAMRTWLLTIARRISITEGQRRRLSSDPSILGATLAAPEQAEHSVDREDRRRHTRELLDRAMVNLSAPQREALTLFYQQQLSVDEVAQVMEMPVGTVKSHLFRARAALQEQLAPHAEEFLP